MGVEIPIDLLRRMNGSKILHEEWGPLVGCPEPDGSAATDAVIRRDYLLPLEQEYNRQRIALGDMVTTSLEGYDIVIHTDSEAVRVNERLATHGMKKVRKAARQYAAINRSNLNDEERREHIKGLERLGRIEAAVRQAARRRPTVTPTVSRVPKLGHQSHVVREVFDHA